MLEFLERLFDATRHGESDGLSVVVPIQADANAFCVFINLEVVVFSDACCKVVQVLLVSVLHKEVVNNQSEIDILFLVLEESFDQWVFDVAVSCKALNQVFVRNPTSLFQAMSCLVHLGAHVTIWGCQLGEVTCLNS